VEKLTATIWLKCCWKWRSTPSNKQINIKDVLYLHMSNPYTYRGGQFYWWRKSEDPETTTDLSQVTDKLLSHNVVSTTPYCTCIWVTPTPSLITFSRSDSLVPSRLSETTNKAFFSHIVAVSFIGEENRRTRRQPPTCRKSLTTDWYNNVVREIKNYYWWLISIL
jgi:hypothetical protein